MNYKQTALYCQQLEELIAGCDPDDPIPEKLAAVEEHIEQCPVCESAETVLDRTVVEFRSADPHGVTAAFEESLVERLCRAKDSS